MKIHNKNQNPINPTTTSISSTSKKPLKRSEEEEINELNQSFRWLLVKEFGEDLIKMGKEFNKIMSRLKEDSITEELCLAFNNAAFALERAEDTLQMEEERHTNKFKVGSYEPFIHYKYLPHRIKIKIKDMSEERVTMSKLREWMTNEEWYHFEISVSFGDGLVEVSDVLTEIDRIVA